MAVSSAPKRASAGAPFPTTDRLEVWFCEMNPRRHVEVRTWGLRPVKDCSVAGCKGVMIHSDKGRLNLPLIGEKPAGAPYNMMRFEPGWVCMEDESHFEPGERP